MQALKELKQLLEWILLVAFIIGEWVVTAVALLILIVLLGFLLSWLGVKGDNPLLKALFENFGPIVWIVAAVIMICRRLDSDKSFAVNLKFPQTDSEHREN